MSSQFLYEDVQEFDNISEVDQITWIHNVLALWWVVDSGYFYFWLPFYIFVLIQKMIGIDRNMQMKWGN